MKDNVSKSSIKGFVCIVVHRYIYPQTSLGISALFNLLLFSRLLMTHKQVILHTNKKPPASPHHIRSRFTTFHGGTQGAIYHGTSSPVATNTHIPQHGNRLPPQYKDPLACPKARPKHIPIPIPPPCELFI